MDSHEELKRQAHALPIDGRKRLLLELTEPELREQLRCLFISMLPLATVEITHGNDEYGKDLVIVRDETYGTEGYAVVVKAGDKITGKTRGAVDEIKSQVEQSFAHPAVLKSRVGRLSVSEVWVVLAGGITKNVVERLERELVGRTRVYALDELVDLFTVHYPEVFFTGAVMDYIQTQLVALETNHVLGQRNRTLTQCFVDPYVATIDMEIELGENAAPMLLRQEKMPFARFEHARLGYRKVLLLGEPGVGKSAAVAMMAIEGLTKASHELVKAGRDAGTVSVPVLLRARDVAAAHGVAEAVDVALGKAVQRAEVRMVLVDGLDEVPPAERENVLAMVGEYSDQTGCPVVVSSRHVEAARKTAPGFERFELLPMEFGQALKLFEKIVDDQSVLAALRDGLAQVHSRVELTPLSVLLLIELAENHQEIPASVTELYTRFAEEVLGKYDKKKGIDVLFDHQRKRLFVAALAHDKFVMDDCMEIPVREYAQYLEHYFDRKGWDLADLAEFSNEIQRTCILDIGAEDVRFRHKSFLEYFAAYHLFTNQQEMADLDELLPNMFFDEYWSDVVFYYVGLKSALSAQMLDALINYDDDNYTSAVNKFMIGRLLQAGWESDADEKRRGVGAVLEQSGAVRERFLSLVAQAGKELPEILGDSLVMYLGDTSLRSGVLAEYLREYMDSAVLETEEDIRRYTYALRAVQRFLDNDGQRRMYTDKALDALDAVTDKTAQLRGLTLLMIADKSAPDYDKALEKRWMKQVRKYPGIARSVLPERKSLPGGRHQQAASRSRTQTAQATDPPPDDE